MKSHVLCNKFFDKLWFLQMYKEPRLTTQRNEAVLSAVTRHYLHMNELANFEVWTWSVILCSLFYGQALEIVASPPTPYGHFYIPHPPADTSSAVLPPT